MARERGDAKTARRHKTQSGKRPCTVSGGKPRALACKDMQLEATAARSGRHSVEGGETRKRGTAAWRWAVTTVPAGNAYSCVCNRKRTPVIFFIDGRGAVVAKGSTAREGAR